MKNNYKIIETINKHIYDDVFEITYKIRIDGKKTLLKFLSSDHDNIINLDNSDNLKKLDISEQKPKQKEINFAEYVVYLIERDKDVCDIILSPELHGILKGGERYEGVFNSNGDGSGYVGKFMGKRIYVEKFSNVNTIKCAYKVDINL